MAFERQAAQNNPFTFSELLFSRNVFFSTLISDYDWLFAAPYLSLVLCAQYGQKYHCSIQHNKLYLDVKCITKQRYSSDLWPLKDKRNCIVDKSLKIKLKSSTFKEVDGGNAGSFICRALHFRYCVWFRVYSTSSYWHFHTKSQMQTLTPIDTPLSIFKYKYKFP